MTRPAVARTVFSRSGRHVRSRVDITLGVGVPELSLPNLITDEEMTTQPEQFHDMRFPDEPEEYRRARDELLRVEAELRDRTEVVTEQRRRLPLRAWRRRPARSDRSRRQANIRL